MRVISGLRKGHKLKCPKGNNVRPTEDKIKESLFNILGPIDKEAIVLDGFGGTGSIGIEFLSRGAKTSYFVDNSMESIEIINENLRHTKFIDQGVVIKIDIIGALKVFASKGVSFDYIYLDPPFRQEGLIESILEQINKENVLEDFGVIIIEHEKELVLNDELFGFVKTDFRKYGSKSLSFFKVQEWGGG